MIIYDDYLGNGPKVSISGSGSSVELYNSSNFTDCTININRNNNKVIFNK